VAFDPRYALERLITQPITAGTALAHSHRADPATGNFPFNAFNPSADTRFAGCLATPVPAAFYGGTTLECALWESDLRHVVGDRHGVVTLRREQFLHRRLTFIRTTRDLHVIELYPSILVGMAPEKEVQYAWTELTTCNAHAPTHAPAAQLLAQAQSLGVHVDGFAWYSRQCGTRDTHPTVYVFFSPPGSPSSFIEDPHRAPIALDGGTKAWEAIDAALALANLRRARGGVGAILAPEPDEE
jgi:hypothetical protein